MNLETKDYPAEKQAEIAAEIIQKAVEVSNSTSHDVFVHYSPHVKWIDIVVHRGGWKEHAGDLLRVGFSWYEDTEADFKEVMAVLDDLNEDAEK